VQALPRQRLSLSLEGAFAKNCDELFGRDFAPLGPLMNGFILNVRNVALVFEAPDDASGIAGFFGWGTGVFRCLTHMSNSLAGMTSRSFDRAPIILTY
jgi:hypothetical protein